MNKGIVYLVGAGCGQADLITVRGMRLLQSCDAVVYDDLIDLSLLTLAPCGTYYSVGKRCGRHSASQEEINELLVELGRSGKTVVRLKGGDPFVFGRGGEELIALQVANIPCAVVPGVSSCIAAPGAAGIPVTHRGISRGFHVITGHAVDAVPDLRAYADLQDTLVFLMGKQNLQQIAEKLIAAGKPKETPVAVIYGGATSSQMVARGTLTNIWKETALDEPKSPAVIIVGNVAELELCSPIRLQHSLKGIRVGIAATANFAQELMLELQKLDAEAVPVLFEQISSEVNQICCDKIISGDPCWIMLTSTIDVGCFFDALRMSKTDIRQLNKCKFVVIGEDAAYALERQCVRADLYIQKALSEELIRLLSRTLRPKECLILVQSGNRMSEAVDALEERGVSVHVFDIHEATYKPALMKSVMDYLVFESEGSVRAWFSEKCDFQNEPLYVCVDAGAAKILTEMTNAPYLISDEATAQGVVRSILHARI